MDRNETNLGQFRLDVGRRELLRGGTPIKLGSRALDILCVLAGAKGDVVSKDDLMAQVWPGLVVEENNIQVHISALRKALDEGAGGQSHVVTVPGRGYRLVGLQPSMRPVDPKLDQPPAVPATPSIAVLPFHNMSNDPDQDYFADGIVEDIITGLSRIKWFLVIARNSSFTYKGKPIDVKQIDRST